MWNVGYTNNGNSSDAQKDMLFCQDFSLITVSSYFVRMTLKKSKLDARTKRNFPASVLVFSPGRTPKRKKSYFPHLNRQTHKFTKVWMFIITVDVPYLGVDTRGLSSGCTLCEHEEDQSLLLIFINFETYAHSWREGVFYRISKSRVKDQNINNNTSFSCFSIR